MPTRLRDSLARTDPLVLAGIPLTALALALGSTTLSSNWRIPVVVFLGTLGACALAGPLVRSWREREQYREEDWAFSWSIPIAIMAGLVVLIAYRSGGSPRNTVVALLLVAGAATLVGVLIGFLFGIPRVAAKAPHNPDDDASVPVLETNTNLELISDWLTKIIIGVTLVQARDLVDRFDTLLENLARAGFPRPLMGGTILFFLVAGFLNGYLWTRLILTRQFSLSERSLRETTEYFEGLMNAYLYQPPPRGFRKTLQLFERYRKRFGDPRHWRVWVYAACAYGQQYEWQRKAESIPPSDPRLQPTIDRAKEAIHGAIASGVSRKLIDTLIVEGDDGDLVLLAQENEAVRTLLQGASV